MTDMEREILNAKWVSVPRGSEYFSFHLKNEEEERLFHWEDERYEIDQYIDLTNNTLAALRNLSAEYNKNKDISAEEFEALKNKYVSVVKLNWIKHIYNYNQTQSENDERVVLLNLTNPVVMPVIIKRLEVISDNWEQTRREKQK